MNIAVFNLGCGNGRIATKEVKGTRKMGKETNKGGCNVADFDLASVPSQVTHDGLSVWCEAFSCNYLCMTAGNNFFSQLAAARWASSARITTASRGGVAVNAVASFFLMTANKRLNQRNERLMHSQNCGMGDNVFLLTFHSPLHLLPLTPPRYMLTN